MNKEPIENAIDADLRLSKSALLRAARRAHELAAQTGTCIVVRESGVLRKIHPDSGESAFTLHEPAPVYKEES